MLRTFGMYIFVFVIPSFSIPLWYLSVFKWREIMTKKLVERLIFFVCFCLELEVNVESYAGTYAWLVYSINQL